MQEDIVRRDVTPDPPISVRWFANRQRAATFTLDLEIDWSVTPLFSLEFVVGIGFQVGFAFTWMPK